MTEVVLYVCLATVFIDGFIVGHVWGDDLWDWITRPKRKS